MASYDAGSLIRLSATFAVGSSDTDPTTITVTVEQPSGTATAYTYAASQVVRDGAGLYHYDLDTTGGAAGCWRYKWAGSAPAQSAADGWFYLNVPF